jgi:hypothetical protein
MRLMDVKIIDIPLNLNQSEDMEWRATKLAFIKECISR